MTERQSKILEALALCQRMEVSALAELLQVSQVTIRKDLDQLEDRGLIRREHGVAVFGSLDDVGRRMAIHYEVKRRIAQAAAASVEEKETVMVESGSCCALLAEELANANKGITIVTNSTFIANHLRYARTCRLILLGGEYQPEAQVLVGSITRKCAEIFFSDKFFIGADGFIEKYGFTGRNHIRTQTVRDMAEQAEKIIVLTESEKFFQRGAEGIVRAEDVATVYTDDRIPPEKEKFLNEQGVIVTKVPAFPRSKQPLIPLVRVPHNAETGLRYQIMPLAAEQT
ncbi:MAG: DeoR/GlpR family DNA-binding transcription regulator [Spirochaetaceae bacterium]|jgi:DeoR/GlpR family transcriptional regulator of sugar metabolism|nr:DeoR/GlpR family DNA-binding transcription regulator [Spirochaetaceae bacterium]